MSVFQRAASPTPTEPDVDVVETGVGSKAGVYRQDKAAAVLKGKKPVPYDKRKFNYDVTRGKSENIQVEVSKDDRMSAVEAGAMLNHIHELMGIDREVEGVLRAFDKALFFSHTVNGGSVLSPGRSSFGIPGVTREFSYGDIRDILGNDQRRFFRAFADEIAEMNKEVLRDYDPMDVVAVEQYAWLMQVAYARGLQRYPYLAHDSADACKSVSPAERAALNQSKTMVISSVSNTADRLKANSRTGTVDGYNSTTGDRD